MHKDIFWFNKHAHFIFGRNLVSWYIFLVEHAVIILFWSFPPRDIFQRNNPHKCVLIYSCPVKNWCLSYSRPSYTSWWSYEVKYLLCYVALRLISTNCIPPQVQILLQNTRLSTRHFHFLLHAGSIN